MCRHGLAGAQTSRPLHYSPPPPSVSFSDTCLLHILATTLVLVTTLDPKPRPCSPERCWAAIAVCSKPGVLWRTHLRPRAPMQDFTSLLPARPQYLSSVWPCLRKIMPTTLRSRRWAFSPAAFCPTA